MAATTNVPLPQFLPTGLSIASEQAILTGVQGDYSQSFALAGKTLSVELTTPQGQLMSSQAYMVAAFQAALAQLVANVDPMTSSGAYQDALGRIYFLTRQAATYTLVTATVGGIVGQTLPAGSQAVDTNGNVYASQTAVTFGSGGTATVVFQALVAGSSVVCGAGQLNRIYQQVNGWQSVTNAAAGVTGQDVESRAEFEERRAASVQIGGQGSIQAIRAAVANVPGVTDVFAYDNGSDAAITYGATNYPIPAHSIVVSVTGGDKNAIAQAIWTKKDVGAGYSSQGVTTVAVTDSVNYGPPYPTYQVSFVWNPAPTNVFITVNVPNISSLPAAYIPLVQQAVANAFTNGYTSPDGTINIGRARIGGQILSNQFSVPVSVALGGITPVSIFVAFTSAPTSGYSVTMGIDQQPVCVNLNVTVNKVSV
jgi:hypothetical protein